MPDHGGAWELLGLIVGLVLIWRGTMPLVRARRWRAGALSARGRVVDHMLLGTGGRREARRPVIEFEAYGLTFVLPTDETPVRPWPVGYPVEVLYDRSDPHRAGLAHGGWAIPWTLVAGVAVVGAFVAVIAL
jgi:hypothetical protein